eukprot:4954829-Amphidinium_carterae.1
MASVEQRSVGETSTDSRQYQQHSMTTEPPQQQLQQFPKTCINHTSAGNQGCVEHTEGILLCASLQLEMGPSEGQSSGFQVMLKWKKKEDVVAFEC